jgi:hypothetical protein
VESTYNTRSTDYYDIRWQTLAIAHFAPSTWSPPVSLNAPLHSVFQLGAFAERTKQIEKFLF